MFDEFGKGTEDFAGNKENKHGRVRSKIPKELKDAAAKNVPSYVVDSVKESMDDMQDMIASSFQNSESQDHAIELLFNAAMEKVENKDMLRSIVHIFATKTINTIVSAIREQSEIERFTDMLSKLSGK